MTSRRQALAALGLTAACGAQASGPADYPSRPVTILAPFAAGGTVDIVARMLGQKLGQELGQSFVVDNKGGAGRQHRTGMLARSAPDGYTLMVHHMGLAFNASLYDNLSFDTARDILPLAYVGATPNVLVVANSLPVSTVPDFINLARMKPGTINFGSGGMGSAGHLPMEVLQSITGVKLQHVPYKGSGPAINDLIAGQIQAMLLTIPAVMPFIQGGKLKALATSGAQRTPALPQLPTLAEAGVKDFEFSPWYGVFAPAGLPPAIAARLHTTINRVLTQSEIAKSLAQQGLEVQALTREQFAVIVKSDIAKWASTIKRLGVKGE